MTPLYSYATDPRRGGPHELTALPSVRDPARDAGRRPRDRDGHRPAEPAQGRQGRGLQGHDHGRSRP